MAGPLSYRVFRETGPRSFPDSGAKFHPEELGTTAELDEVAPRNSKPVVKKKYVGNPWQEADQLAFISVATRAEVGTMKKKQHQQVVRAGFEPGILGFQVWRPNHSVRLPSV